MRDKLRELGPKALERLDELQDSDNEFIATTAAKFLAEKALEVEMLNGDGVPAARMTVSAEKVQEAQRVLTEGETNAEEDRDA